MMLSAEFHYCGNQFSDKEYITYNIYTMLLNRRNLYKQTVFGRKGSHYVHNNQVGGGIGTLISSGLKSILKLFSKHSGKILKTAVDTGKDLAIKQLKNIKPEDVIDTIGNVGKNILNRPKGQSVKEAAKAQVKEQANIHAKIVKDNILTPTLANTNKEIQDAVAKLRSHNISLSNLMAGSGLQYLR